MGKNQDLILNLRAENNDLKRKLSESERYAKKTTKSMQGAFGKLNFRTFLYGTFGLYAVQRGLKATMKPAIDFETQLAKVSTMLDKSSMRHMKNYRTELQSLSTQYGESTKTLSKGLYDILSASIPASKAIDVLGVSSRAAIAGLTTTAISADAITTILNSYGMAAEEAARVSDILFATVKRGKTEFGELASAIGMVSATAAQVGLDFEEMQAAISTMTRQGINVHRSTIALMNILNAFLTPTDAAREAARKFGIELSTTWLAAYKFSGMMEKLTDATSTQVAEIFPSVRGLRGMNAALGDMSGYLRDLSLNYDAVGLSNEALNKRTETLKIKFNRLGQEITKIIVSIGEGMKPVIDDMTYDVIEFANKNQDAANTISNSLGVMGSELYKQTAIFRKIFGYWVKGFSRLLDEIRSVVQIINNLETAIRNIPKNIKTTIKLAFEFEGTVPEKLRGTVDALLNSQKTKNGATTQIAKGFKTIQGFDIKTGLPWSDIVKDYTPKPLSREENIKLREQARQRKINSYNLTQELKSTSRMAGFRASLYGMQGSMGNIPPSESGGSYFAGKKPYESKLGSNREYKPQKEAAELSRQLFYETEIAKANLLEDSVKRQQAILVTQRDWEIAEMEREIETDGKREEIKLQIMEKYALQSKAIADDSTHEIAQGWITLSNQISNVMANAAMESGNAFKNIAKAFEQMLLKMAADLAAKAILFSIINAFTMGAGGAGIGALGGNFWKFAFPGFASGGMAYTPQLAMVGENGPERILNPEETRAYNKNISDDHSALTINYYGGSQPDTDMIDNLRTAWRDGQLDFLRGV